MKIIPILSLLITCSACAGYSDNAAKAALNFNKWYIAQYTANKFPITDNAEINKYVTASTMKKLRHAQDPRFADEEFYDADFFLKSQDIEEDWADNVTVVSSEYDPVCTNIYVSFGKKEEYTVIDCMVKEKGIWKIQSVSGQAIQRNEHLK
ncbi:MULTISPECIES: DUF3828 domain-containing protein [Enterobacter]|uniref:DUF3828 domain-containing protein n=1 Tax=Enterobacter TaxID=547 RepID=UPI000FEBCF3D|nr:MULTISPECIES: DUF3828 domain-containing protein [Enterobacter]HEO9145869.1 DUF3828 domain-containing protein [Enterobacter asburiae]MCR1302144.1 YbjP/YqhG family protein [Enterobacter sp. FL1277]MCR1307095.1 YbjP/YqhG family protein [Enterobacter sp. BT1271]MCR1312919.1 YbjP/YqhG family protein [Enterobacter sp. BT855]MCR1324152.1 YbjP/YqhG family protein [Enterobacter sp. BT1268]